MKIKWHCKAHPDVPVAQLKYLLEISKGNADAVSDLLLQGLTLQDLIDFLKTTCFLVQNMHRLTIDGYYNPESLTQEAIAYYKGSWFSPNAEICISIGDQLVIDTGGVRRQFFCDVFTHISTSTSLRLFEGSENHLRPVFFLTDIYCIWHTSCLLGKCLAIASSWTAKDSLFFRQPATIVWQETWIKPY